MKLDTWKNPEAIVSCEWLSKNLNNNNIRIYDCTTYLHYRDNDSTLPYIVESGRENYEICNIQNSSFLDLHYDLSDQTSPFRFTLPKLEILADSFKKKGIGSRKRFELGLLEDRITFWDYIRERAVLDASAPDS